MKLFMAVALRYFQSDGRGNLTPEGSAELKKIDALNNLTLDDFLQLPSLEREIAEDLWTARTLDASNEVHERQSAEVRRRLIAAHPEFA